MAVVRFLSKSGERFVCDVSPVDGQLPAKVEAKIPSANVSREANSNVERLARALFDKRFSQEAIVRGEGNVQRALDIFWNKTKLKEREAAMAEAASLSTLMDDSLRTFKLYKSRGGGECYLELGCVFNDLTAADAPAPRLEKRPGFTVDPDAGAPLRSPKLMDTLKPKDEERNIRLSWRAKRADPEWWHKISETAGDIE